MASIPIIHSFAPGMKRGVIVALMRTSHDHMAVHGVFVIRRSTAGTRHAELSGRILTSDRARLVACGLWAVPNRPKPPPARQTPRVKDKVEELLETSFVARPPAPTATASSDPALGPGVGGVRPRTIQAEAPFNVQVREQVVVAGSSAVTNVTTRPGCRPSTAGLVNDRRKQQVVATAAVVRTTDLFQDFGRLPVQGAPLRRNPGARPQSACPVGSGGAHLQRSASVGTRKQAQYVKERISSQVFGGEYALGKALGQGAYATVRQGTHSGTGHKVAIKCFDKQKSGGWDNRKKQIAREVRLMEKAHHGNIVKFYEVVDTALHLYIVAEVVDGGSLRQFLNRQPHRRLDEAKVRQLYYQVCDGINYLHQRCIAHRDIKLENLLLDREAAHVKIIDFGFAVQTGDRNQRLKSFCGTPSYMCPEIINGEYNGFQADVWALGVVLYVMLTGRFPFKGQNERELYMKIKRGAFHCPESLDSTTKRLVRGIMRTDGSARPTIEQILSHPWLETAVPEISSGSASLSSVCTAERSVCDSQAATVCTPREAPVPSRVKVEEVSGAEGRRCTT